MRALGFLILLDATSSAHAYVSLSRGACSQHKLNSLVIRNAEIGIPSQSPSTVGGASRREVAAQYEKMSNVEQLGSVVLASGMAVLSSSEILPPLLRLASLTYMTWSLWEYGFHRIAMHAKRNSRGKYLLLFIMRCTDCQLQNAADKVFSGYNRLHILHHAETNTDMTMRDDFEPHGIYFSYKTSIGATIASIASLAALQTSLPRKFLDYSLQYRNFSTT